MCQGAWHSTQRVEPVHVQRQYSANSVPSSNRIKGEMRILPRFADCVVSCVYCHTTQLSETHVELKKGVNPHTLEKLGSINILRGSHDDRVLNE